MQCAQDRDHQEIKNSRGKNTKEAPEVEGVYVDVSGF